MDHLANLEESQDLSAAQPVVTIHFDFHYQRGSVHIRARQGVDGPRPPRHAACSLDQTQGPATIGNGPLFKGPTTNDHNTEREPSGHEPSGHYALVENAPNRFRAYKS
jgi:hypothetical protein